MGSSLDTFTEQQNKSFFKHVMEQNMEHFKQGKVFIDLIDFKGGNPQNLPKDEEYEEAESTGYRKSSFTLVEDQQNNQKLKEALQKVKGDCGQDN